MTDGTIAKPGELSLGWTLTVSEDSETQGRCPLPQLASAVGNCPPYWLLLVGRSDKVGGARVQEGASPQGVRLWRTLKRVSVRLK